METTEKPKRSEAKYIVGVIIVAIFEAQRKEVLVSTPWNT